LFICGAQPEYQFVKEKFGYPEKNIAYLGFSRFDQLHEIHVDKDMILVMPTWRQWLARPIKSNYNLDDLEHFENTEYCIRWNEFLNHPELLQLLNQHQKRIFFYPHRNMQKYLSYFHANSELIQIADRNQYDVQDLLKRAGLLITDYSSVFFDFAYMRKPVLFYQFDEEKFRENQYQRGYFDYRKSQLGECCFSCEDLIPQIKKLCENNFQITEEQRAIIGKFFPLYDCKNCERNYTAILND
jgi:putative glycosyl/glycerophosphate transferases involved in teichoic acid biosynthesis tagF/tagB/epsJ/rodC